MNMMLFSLTQYNVLLSIYIYYKYQHLKNCQQTFIYLLSASACYFLNLILVTFSKSSQWSLLCRLLLVHSFHISSFRHPQHMTKPSKLVLFYNSGHRLKLQIIFDSLILVISSLLDPQLVLVGTSFLRDTYHPYNNHFHLYQLID